MKNLLEMYFAKKLSPLKIERYLKSIPPQPEPPPPQPNTLKAACVERSIKPVSNVNEYMDLLHGFVKQAAQEQCHLIIFPEYNFFDLFGLIPGFKIANRYLNQKAEKAVNSQSHDSGGGLGPLYTVLYAVSAPIQRAVELIMMRLAEKYKISIYTGSYMLKENGHLFNAGSLISKEGWILATQKKIHLTDFEAEMGIQRDCSLQIQHLYGMQTAIPVCMDATYFETFHAAQRMGADIIILPIANNEEYNVYKSLRGIWPRVQESHVYGLKASLNGWIAGMHFTGKAGIFAPIAMTEKKDGVIALAPHHEGDHLVTGVLDLSQLYRERETAEYFGDTNPDFERDYIEKVYFSKKGGEVNERQS